MASQPRINSTLVIAIRMARMSRSSNAGGAPKVYHFVQNQNRPDKAYTTERAKRAGKANACSGKIFVTVPPDHFGPIPAENDPERNMGVLVGEIWEDRLACRQWGAHLPHVAGIAGQSTHGSQSVALSGGYLDDEDHGEWFLYTGRYAVLCVYLCISVLYHVLFTSHEYFCLTKMLDCVSFLIWVDLAINTQLMYLKCDMKECIVVACCIWHAKALI